MRLLRLVCSAVVSLYLGASCLPQLQAQTPQQQTPPQTPPQTPQQTPPAQPPATPPKPATPPAGGGFESVPAAPATPQPQQPHQQPQQQQLETPKPVIPNTQALNGKVVAGVEFRGTRRTSQDTLKAQITTRPGDIYNEEILRRDFMLLWNTGRFDDIKLETEDVPEGVIVRFVVTERRVIRSIHYTGMHA